MKENCSSDEEISSSLDDLLPPPLRALTACINLLSVAWEAAQQPAAAAKVFGSSCSIQRTCTRKTRLTAVVAEDSAARSAVPGWRRHLGSLKGMCLRVTPRRWGLLGRGGECECECFCCTDGWARFMCTCTLVFRRRAAATQLKQRQWNYTLEGAGGRVWSLLREVMRVVPSLPCL